MIFQNNLYRGQLTVQSHTPEDVVVQMPVYDRGQVQSDDFEPPLALLPLPDLTGVANVDQPETIRAHYAPYYPDFELSQNAVHLLIERPALHALNVDASVHKTLLVQYHDEAGLDIEQPYDLFVFVEYEAPDLP